jgi:hypothetical protein
MISDPRQELLLFIEGLQCPVLSANVSSNLKQDASIEVLATKEIRLLKPGTNVILSYRDIHAEAPILYKAGEPVIPHSVLFLGMLRSLSLNRNASDRRATLTCTGHISLFDRFYTYISNTGSDLFNHKQSFVGAAQFFRSNMGQSGIAMQIRRAYTGGGPPFTAGLQDVTGPARGIIKVIEESLGVTALPGDLRDAHGAQQEYFAHASAQTRLLYQIGAISTDEHVSDILGTTVSANILENSAAQLNDTQTLTTVIDIVLRQMYYKFISICTPVTHLTEDSGESGYRLSALDRLQKTYKTGIDQCVKEDRLTKIINGMVNLETLAKKQKNTSILGIIQGKDYGDVFEETLSGDIDKVRKVSKVTTLTSIAVNLSSILSEYRKQLGDEGRKTSEDIKHIITFSLQSILRKIAENIEFNDSSAQGVKFPRVVSYILTPNLAFCTPPACNVLFPNQISSMSINFPLYDRPTRLLLHSQNVHGGEEGKAGVSGYYAPSVAIFEAEQAATAKKEELTSLMPHEYYTGVVPSFASLSFYDKFKTFKGTGVNMYGNILRIANFNLMLKRYESTTMQVSGPFNPFVSAGMPMAVIDVDDIGGDAPTIYMGLLTSIQHTYSPAGSNTIYALTHVRDVAEVDDIFEGARLSRETTGDKSLYNRLRKYVTPVAEWQQGVAQKLRALTFDEKYTEARPTNKEDPIKSAVSMWLSSLRETESLIINGTPQDTPQFGIIGWADITHKDNATAVSGLRPKEISVGDVDGFIFEGTKVRGEGYTKWESTYNDKEFAELELTNYFRNNPFPLNPEDIYTEIYDGLKRRNLDSAVLLDALELLTELTPINSILDCSMDKVRNGNGYSESILTLLNKQITPDLRLHQLIPPSHNRLRLWILGGKYNTLTKDDYFSTPDSFDRNAAQSFFMNSVTVGSTESIIWYAHEATTSDEDLAIEELYRPPWYSDRYSVASIGKEVYEPIIKIGSVQDKVGSGEFRKAVVNSPLGDVLTHTTKAAIMSAYNAYNALSTVTRDKFVEQYVRRPISHVYDLIGPTGMLDMDIIDPKVVDPTKKCPPEAVIPAGHVSDHRSTSLSIEKLIDLKKSAAITYKRSTSKDAFR